MANGTVNGSIYGGALGKVGDRFVYGGSTVNMTGGWVRGNVYGGSELSNDGKSGEQDEKSASGLVFVNLTGGTVSGKFLVEVSRELLMVPPMSILDGEPLINATIINPMQRKNQF